MQVIQINRNDILTNSDPQTLSVYFSDEKAINDVSIIGAPNRLRDYE